MDQIHAITPCYPREEVFVDPTHVNFISKGTHQYFTTPLLTAQMYGFNGKFEVVKVKQVFSRLEKRKSTFSRFLKDIYYTLLNRTKKSHIVWKFKTIKGE